MSKRKFARIRSRHPSHKGLKKNKLLLFPEKVVVRLGSTTEVDIKREINSIQAVKNSIDKLVMKGLFVQNNIPTTKYYLLNQISKVENLKFPILAKKRFGSKGKGMVKIDTQEQLDDFLKGNTRGYYFEEYFNGSREYRIHTSTLGAFYSCRKLRREDAEDRWYFNSNNCIWATEYDKVMDENDKFIEFSKTPNALFNKPENWNEMLVACKNALTAIGLEIGAIDLRCKKDGSFVILETNSAPSFGEITHIKYVEQLKQLINSKY